MSKRSSCLASSLTPDDIMFQIHQALKFDLLPLTATQQLYGGRGEAGDLFVETQINDFKKKYKSQCTKTAEKTKAVAISKFLENAIRLSVFDASVQYPDSTCRARRDEPRRDRILRKAHHFANTILGELDYEEWFEGCKNSSGSTVGTNFNDTSVEAKFTYPISTTESQLRLFRIYLEWDPQFRDAILAHNLGRELEFDVVDGSSLVTVDKDDRTDRVICKETTVGMFLQQGLMDVLVRRLRPYLDFKHTQNEHRWLAFTSSISGKNATIDWASASDSVLRSASKFLLRNDWFYALDTVRSPLVSYNGHWLDLPMLSTMGNATTFPIETLMFYTIAVACCDPDNLSILVEPSSIDKVSVFGDDCILPVEHAELFISVCSSIGMTVNESKTFITGAFRESCGGDFLDGRNVRPYFIRAPHNDKPSSLEAWMYVIVNRLIKKYISYFGGTSYVYKQVFQVWASLCRKMQIVVKFVPPNYPEDSGVQIFSDILRFAKNVVRRKDRMPVYVSRHGSVKFSFLRFQYTEERGTSKEFTYWKLLKFDAAGRAVQIFDQFWNEQIGKPLASEASSFFRKTKRIGGYVPGTGWSFDQPDLKILLPTTAK